MNRRVVLTVTDDQGRTVGAGGAGDAIRAITNTAPPPDGRRRRLLQRSVEAPGQAGRHRQDAQGSGRSERRAAQGSRRAPAEPAGPGSAAEPARSASAPRRLRHRKSPTRSSGSWMPRRLRNSRCWAPTSAPTATATSPSPAKAGSSTPWARASDSRRRASIYYVRGQREGQADFGLVDRLGKRVQAGLFASFKHVTLAGNQTGGTLGEGALAVDYIFSRGRVGIFGTKGFLDNALINRANGVDANGVFQNNVILENYLKIVDQAGRRHHRRPVGQELRRGQCRIPQERRLRRSHRRHRAPDLPVERQDRVHRRGRRQ